MSCYWDIRCVDCGVDAGIDNANHMMETMQTIVRVAPALGAAFAALGDELVRMPVELQVCGKYVPARFLAEHGQHRLRPVDEYGAFDTPCGKRFFCELCGVEVECRDREHPGNRKCSHLVGNVLHDAK